MNTSAIYGNITNSIEITYDLIALSNKVLVITNNDVKITKSNIIG